MMKRLGVALVCSFLFGQPLWAQTETKSDIQPQQAVQKGDGSTVKNDVIEAAKQEPMTFQMVGNGGNCLTCTWIAAEGTITPDTPEKFLAFLEEQHLSQGAYGVSLVFHSGGGDILAAIALGREIRKIGMTTTVGQTIKDPQMEAGDDKAIKVGECVDACVWAYLGGHTRYLGASRLALKTYRPPLDEAGTTSGLEVPMRLKQLADMAYIGAYAREMGFDPSIAYIDWQNAEPHQLSDQEIKIYKIIFQPEQFGAWTLKAMDGGVIATNETRDGKGTAALYCDVHKKIHLEVSIPARSDKESYQTFIDLTKKLDVFGKTYPTKNAHFDVVDGTLNFSLELKAFEFSKIHGDQLSISGKDTPAVADGIFSLNFVNQQNLTTIGGIIRRNCLK